MNNIKHSNKGNLPINKQSYERHHSKSNVMARKKDLQDQLRLRGITFRVRDTIDVLQQLLNTSSTATNVPIPSPHTVRIHNQLYRWTLWRFETNATLRQVLGTSSAAIGVSIAPSQTVRNLRQLFRRTLSHIDNTTI